MTDPHDLNALDRLAELVISITDQMRGVVLAAHEDDQEALREGVVTIEVGRRHLEGEVDRIRGRLAAADGLGPPDAYNGFGTAEQRAAGQSDVSTGLARANSARDHVRRHGSTTTGGRCDRRDR